MTRSAASASTNPRRASVPCVVSIRIICLDGTEHTRVNPLCTLSDQRCAGSVTAEVVDDGNGTSAAAGGVTRAIANRTGLVEGLASWDLRTAHGAGELGPTAARRPPCPHPQQLHHIDRSTDQACGCSSP